MYLCVHPICYCHRDVRPSPEHDNPARLEDCADDQGWNTRPSVINLACYLPVKRNNHNMGSHDHTKDTKIKQQPRDHTAALDTGGSSMVYLSSRMEQGIDQPPHNHDGHTIASEGCKENVVGAVETTIKEPVQATAEPQDHPSESTSMHLSSAWTDIDFPVSIWNVKNLKAIRRKKPIPPQPASGLKSRSGDDKTKKPR
jgi:hypothetical protein